MFLKKLSFHVKNTLGKEKFYSATSVFLEQPMDLLNTYFEMRCRVDYYRINYYVGTIVCVSEIAVTFEPMMLFKYP